VMTSTRMIGSTYTGKEILGISMIPSDRSPLSLKQELASTFSTF
jgi:hypothetical protein